MNIVIVGGGGFGREVLSLIRQVNQAQETFNVLGFIDDGLEKGTKIHDLQVLGDVASVNTTRAEGAVLAIGNTLLRKDIYKRLPTDIKYPNIVHPQALFQDMDRIEMGEGNIICAGNIFTTDIELGSYNIFNLMSTIGHDVNIGDFCSIMPGVNISGGAQLQDGVYIGTGAKLIKATSIGKNSTIGAGAVVDIDVESNQTVVGVPARPIRIET